MRVQKRLKSSFYKNQNWFFRVKAKEKFFLIEKKSRPDIKKKKNLLRLSQRKSPFFLFFPHNSTEVLFTIKGPTQVGPPENIFSQLYFFYFSRWNPPP